VSTVLSQPQRSSSPELHARVTEWATPAAEMACTNAVSRVPANDRQTIAITMTGPIDQRRAGDNNTPPADLRRRALSRGHSGVTPRPRRIIWRGYVRVVVRRRGGSRRLKPRPRISPDEVFFVC